MQEKQAIITLNYGYEINAWYKYMREVFVPSIKDYAKRINVDFILMNNNNSKYYNTWNQLQFMDYLDYYNRVMYIDGDCYVPKLFRRNFFNKVDKDKIGLYHDAFAVNKNCNVTFIIMILNKINREYFIPPPPIHEQEYKWSDSSSYICPQWKDTLYSCYINEECFINERIYTNKIKDKIQYLTNLKTRGFDFSTKFLTFNLISSKDNVIFHFQLSSLLDSEQLKNISIKELKVIIDTNKGRINKIC